MAAQGKPRSLEGTGGREQVDIASDPVWIFGYGSLLWKINFPYQDKMVGYVKGYSRKFWQGSTDHRGLPGAPGRVVTIVEEPQEITWGVAYKVDPHDIPEVMDYLNHREKNGYTTMELLFHPNSDLKVKPFVTLMYIATITNPMFLGPAPIEAIAEQVVKSRGPSGCNTEYVLNLAQAMREITPLAQDDHLFALERRINEMVEESLLKVRQICGREESTDGQEKDSNCTCNYCDVIKRTLMA